MPGASASVLSALQRASERAGTRTGAVVVSNAPGASLAHDLLGLSPSYRPRGERSPVTRPELRRPRSASNRLTRHVIALTVSYVTDVHLWDWWDQATGDELVNGPSQS